MKKFAAAALLAALAMPAAAQTTELNVLTPGVVYNAGLLDLAADYTKQTGIKVTVKVDGMAAIVNDIKKATPIADVIALPVAFMDGMETEGSIVAGSRADLGRVGIGLAVKKAGRTPIFPRPRNLQRCSRPAAPSSIPIPPAAAWKRASSTTCFAATRSSTASRLASV